MLNAGEKTVYQHLFFNYLSYFQFTINNALGQKTKTNQKKKIVTLKKKVNKNSNKTVIHRPMPIVLAK